MKKLVLTLSAILVGTCFCQAQVYSNGYNNIGGTYVGIGTASPTGNLHVKSAGPTYSVIQADANNATAALRIQDASGTANEIGISKFGAAVGGTFMGISRNSMGTINSLTGPFVFNGGGRMIFGTSMTVSPFTQTPRLYIDSFAKIYIGAATDNVGVGSTTVPPLEKLHINSTAANTNLKITNATSGNAAGDGLLISTTGLAAGITNKENSTLTFGTNNTTRMTILSTGGVMIGTTTNPAGYKLYVESGILTEKIKVALKTSANWADFVFGDNYKLQPLSEVETYIRQNRHLPGVPSADELVESGIDLASMDAKLMEKIEELTLHLIRLEKEVDELKNANQTLKVQNDKLNK